MYPGLSVVPACVLEEVPLDCGADDLFVGLHLLFRGRNAVKGRVNERKSVFHGYLILRPLK